MNTQPMNRDKRDQIMRDEVALECALERYAKHVNGSLVLYEMVDAAWEKEYAMRTAENTSVDYDIHPPLDDQFADSPIRGQAAEINARR